MRQSTLELSLFALSICALPVDAWEMSIRTKAPSMPFDAVDVLSFFATLELPWPAFEASSHGTFVVAGGALAECLRGWSH